MTIHEIFEQKETELIVKLVEREERRWESIANRPLIGYGSASELDKKEKALQNAKECRDLLNKICDLSF